MLIAINAMQNVSISEIPGYIKKWRVLKRQFVRLTFFLSSKPIGWSIKIKVIKRR